MKIAALVLCGAGWLYAAPGFPEIPPYVLPNAKMAVDDGHDPMDDRLFRTTRLRPQVSLAGWWDFVTDHEEAGETRQFYRNFPAPETRLWVPGTWNSQARYWQYQGVAWYRRVFDAPEAGHLRLRFGSVFHRAKVWVDGECLGEHEGGYLPFAFVVRNARKGPHTVTVRVDNRLNDRSLPKRNVDWFPYGGMDRPVYAERVPDAWIEQVHVVPDDITPSQAVLKVKVFLRNLGAAGPRKVAFAVDGRELYAGEHPVAAGDSAVEFRAMLAKPRLWSPAEPNLYSARVALADSDDQFTRFGVRSLRAEGPRLLLNGQRFKVLGANRHEDHPDWGSAVPPHLVRQDIEIIKRLGSNAVRGHYPPADLFMDYCDQNGLVFMNEAPAWQYRPEQLAQTEIQDKIKGFFEGMVYRDMNHPSVITWSLGNEWPEPDKSYGVIKSMVASVRRHDATRLVTFITGGPHVWRVHELIDVICVNWAQYQWYDPFTALDAREGEKSIADLAKIHERYPAKPVILTEFGGSEAQAGWHNWGNVKWSEEFQARNVEDSGRHALEQDWISGGCVWQFCDTRSAPDRFLSGRLHGWNGKGVVDASRSPKLAFYALQRLFKTWR